MQQLLADKMGEQAAARAGSRSTVPVAASGTEYSSQVSNAYGEGEAQQQAPGLHNTEAVDTVEQVNANDLQTFHDRAA